MLMILVIKSNMVNAASNTANLHGLVSLIRKDGVALLSIPHIQDVREGARTNIQSKVIMADSLISQVDYQKRLDLVLI